MPRWTKPNRLFNVQRLTEARDVDGGPFKRWETFRTIYGRVFPLRAEERVQAQRVEGMRSHEIHIRYDSDVNHKHRLVDSEGLTYNVDGVLDIDGRRRYAKVMAVEAVDGG